MYKLSKRTIKKFADGWLESEVFDDDLIRGIKEKITGEMDCQFYLGFASASYLTLDLYDRIGKRKKAFDMIVVHLVARACFLYQETNPDKKVKTVQYLPIYL